MIPIHFILGFIRSGSTLLMALLRQHPEIETDVAEPNFLYRLFVGCQFILEKYQKLGISRPQAMQMFYNSIAAFTDRFYTQLCEQTKKSIVVIKHPYLSPEIAALRQTFPGTKILVLLRHPYDSIASAYDFGIKEQAVRSLFDGAKLPELIAEYKRWMNPLVKPVLDKQENILTIKYEDFLDNPLLILKSIYRFFGVSNDEEVVKKVLKDADDNNLSLTGQHSTLAKSKIFRPIDKFQTVLNNDQRAFVRKELGFFANVFLYDEER